MNKKVFLVIMLIFLLLAGCGKVTSTNTANTAQQPSAETTNSTEEKSSKNISPVTARTINDYYQYVKKTWINKKDISKNSVIEISFSIANINNGKITGRFDVVSFTLADRNLLSLKSNFEGIMVKDVAECQYKDQKGNKGNLKLVFKDNQNMEATITPIDKAHYTVQPPEGTFEFLPDNINNIEGFSLIKDQSFIVDLNSWGNVNFVSGKLTVGNHIPVVFYLTNKEGDILYDFCAELPYSVDVGAVSFEDVNKDELKDIIIIVVDNYDNSGVHIVSVYLQKDDGEFTNDPKLDQEINMNVNNKDIKTVEEYLLKRF